MSFVLGDSQAALLTKRAFELKKRYFPGLCVSITIGIAASFISQRYGAPVMLLALLLGMAFNFLGHDKQCAPGIEFAAKTLLRAGVALLGLRISLGDVVTLGWPPVLMVVIAIAATMLFGAVVSRMLGFSRQFGILTGGSVAICGASAAMAISSVLPNSKDNQRDTLFTVITVTSLSTIAMIFYPLITSFFELDAQQTGMFLGGTIHDVAQVVGAGYNVSEEVGALSVFVKLLRVAMLVPVILLIGLYLRQSKLVDNAESGNKVAVPSFLIGFVVLFALNSTNLVPVIITDAMTDLSAALLVTAIGALGIRTSIGDMLSIGWRPVILVVAETIFIAALVLGFILLLN